MDGLETKEKTISKSKNSVVQQKKFRTAKWNSLGYTKENQIAADSKQDLQLPNTLEHIIQRKLQVVRENAMPSGGIKENNVVQLCNDKEGETEKEKSADAISLAVGEEINHITEDLITSIDEAESDSKLQDVETKPDSANETEEEHVFSGDSIFENGSRRRRLKKKITYKAHGYIYKTNENGFIVYAKADPLRLKAHKGRKTYEKSPPGKEDGFHAGHLIADKFDGSPKLKNIVAMENSVGFDGGPYADLEKEWEKAIKIDGKTVTVEIEMTYPDDPDDKDKKEKENQRPSSFIVTYSIDNKKDTKIISNSKFPLG